MAHPYESATAKEIIMKMNFNCKFFWSRPFLSFQVRFVPRIDDFRVDWSLQLYEGLDCLNAGEPAAKAEDQFPVVHCNPVKA